MSWLRYELEIPENKINLFVKWAKEHFHKRDKTNRVKVSLFKKPTLIIKYRNQRALDSIFKFWVNDYDENTEIISSSYFATTENVKYFNPSYDPNVPSGSLRTSLLFWDFGCMLSNFDSNKIKEWFVSTYGEKWNCITKIVNKEKHWVSELGNIPMNIVDNVLIFHFKNKHDQLMFKLTFDNGKSDYYKNGQHDRN